MSFALAGLGRFLAPALAAGAVLLSTKPAHADAQERTVGFSAGGALLPLRHQGAPGDLEALGLGARGSYGLSNEWEIGGDVQVLVSPAAHWSGASVDGEAGDLYADLYLLRGTLQMRWVPGVARSHHLTRTRPIVGAGLGFELEVLTRQELLSDTAAVITAPPAMVRAHPLAEALLGFEHRFGRSLIVTCTASLVPAAGRPPQVAAAIELAWRWY